MLGVHGVLTSGQLVRLTGLPERTLQRCLWRLHQAGLIGRFRPPRQVGTSPYHCWPTAFGAAAVGAEPPTPWNEDPGGTQAVAALSDL